jgi:hypothetical protein
VVDADDGARGGMRMRSEGEEEEEEKEEEKRDDEERVKWLVVADKRMNYMSPAYAVPGDLYPDELRPNPSGDPTGSIRGSSSSS